MAKKPYQNTRPAKFLETRGLRPQHEKSQAEDAEEAGFVKPNMVAIDPAGATKPPIDRVPPLSGALDCDPVRLLRLALGQSEGSTATVTAVSGAIRSTGEKGLNLLAS